MVSSIFLSHSHEDNAFCQRLLSAVRERIPDTDIFFDGESLIGGDDWLTRIQREVVGRPLFVIVLSQAAVRAEWVREEVNLALRLAVANADRRILPVLRQMCDVQQLAPLLLNRQYIDCASQDERFGFQQLAAALLAPGGSQPPSADPAYEDARRRAAEVHALFSAGQWREVARLGRFASTLPGNERDAALWGELGIALVRIGQAPEGVGALDQALGINRFRVDLWREKALALMYWLRQPAEAIAAWDMAMAATRTPGGRFDLYTEECEALNAVGRWQDALSLSDEALAIERHAPRIWISRGDALLKLNRAVEAISAYDSALALDASNAAALRGKSFALAQAQSFKAALDLCDQYLARYPDDASMWSNKARALAGLQRLDEAQRAVERALSIEPRNATYLGEKALYLLSLARHGAALPVIDTALALAPDSGYLWSLKAAALHGLRRFDEARAAEVCARELGA